MTLVKLQTGELVNEKEIIVEQVRGELSRFMHVVIEDSMIESEGYAVCVDNKLEKNDHLVSHILTTKNYKEAYELALKISYLTGMEVVNKSRFAGTENVPLAVSEIKLFAEKINKAVSFDFDNETQSARVYGVRKKSEATGVVEQFRDNGFDVWTLDEYGEHEVFEIISYFDLYADDVDIKRVKRKIVALEELHASYDYIRDNYNEANEIAMNLNMKVEDKEKFESMLKRHGFETHVNEPFERSVVVYEALQGIVNERGYNKQDKYEHADEGRFNASYTTFVLEVDEERDCILLEHEFEITNDYSKNISMLESILSDIDDSEYKLYIDDEKAWNQYEYYVANPTISQSQVDELKGIAEKIYQLQYEITEIDEASFNSHTKHLGEFAKTLERLYDDIESFTDKF